MADYVYLVVMTFVFVVTVWTAVHKPSTPRKNRYTGIKDLAAWHKNVATRWDD